MIEELLFPKRDTIMSEKLKHCPFCGCENIIVKSLIDKDCDGDPLTLYYYECMDCGAQSCVSAIEDARYHWNKRKEIKPCPFCGGLGQINHAELSDLYSIVCIFCHNKSRDCPTESQAIEAWNTRAEV